MGLLDRIKKLFVGGGGRNASLMDIAVRCDRCGEVVRSQINLQNDLSIQDEDRGIYFARKGLVGSGENRCFCTVEVEYTFDADRNVIDRRIQGGQFVDEGE